MACYPCTHCNKCGMFSVAADVFCAACGTLIGVGVSKCPTCGGTKFSGVQVDWDTRQAEIAKKKAAEAAEQKESAEE